jgi:hypothetical protein
MGRIGHGYGSEWHLLWYLGRHRQALNDHVRKLTGADSVEWLDFPDGRAGPVRTDAEWRGLEFLAPDDPARRGWEDAWPHGSGVHSWDAVARLSRGQTREWLLVEAKAHVAELRSDCGATSQASLARIGVVMEGTKQGLGIDATHDWLRGYYQYCNRIALWHFLERNGHAARLMFVYFTGDERPDGARCPSNEETWAPALDEQAGAVGIARDHPAHARIHKLFLPAYRSVSPAIA